MIDIIVHYQAHVFLLWHNISSLFVCLYQIFFLLFTLPNNQPNNGFW